MKRNYSKLNATICVLVILHLIVSPIRAQNPIMGYTYAGTYNDHVYYLSDCTSDWYNANAAATEMGGYLVAIGDWDENYFVKFLVNAYTWIGLTWQSAFGYSWTNGESGTSASNFIVNFDYSSENTIEPVYGYYWGSGALELHPYLIEFDSNPDCNNPNKQYVCHNGNTICVNNSAVQTHLNHGDYLGPCAGCNNPNAMQTFPDETSPIDGQSLEKARVVLPTPKMKSDVAHEVTSSRRIQIFPNPAGEELHVVLTSNNGEGTLGIFSLTGQEIYTQPVHAQQSMIIDLSKYAPGLYLIDVRCANSHFQKKFVKL